MNVWCAGLDMMHGQQNIKNCWYIFLRDYAGEVSVLRPVRFLVLKYKVPKNSKQKILDL